VHMSRLLLSKGAAAAAARTEALGVLGTGSSDENRVAAEDRRESSCVVLGPRVNN
jgi:hypothetical protein